MLYPLTPLTLCAAAVQACPGKSRMNVPGSAALDMLLCGICAALRENRNWLSHGRALVEGCYEHPAPHRNPQQEALEQRQYSTHAARIYRGTEKKKKKEQLEERNSDNIQAPLGK